jgi:hypothetical protein
MSLLSSFLLYFPSVILDILARSHHLFFFSLFPFSLLLSTWCLFLFYIVNLSTGTIKNKWQKKKKKKVLLVILAAPRLIITFVSKCMKSPNDSWLFLVAYFMSFIPPMLTFVIFILPSKFYKEQFQESIAYYRTIIQRRLHLIV